MVYFDIVENKPFGYFFCKGWLKFIFNVAYYRRVYVSGRENLPKEGKPFMMVSNHQNGLIDALAILLSMPLRYKVVFLARADVFNKKTAAKILNYCKIMPIYRQRDGRSNLGENAAIFDEAAKLVGMGYPVTLFPEGMHQEGHFLGAVKKGFARIAFDAAERNGFPEDMVIVPIGNHYSDYFAMRPDLCVNFGKPIAMSAYYAPYRENPQRAMAALADDVRGGIRQLMLDLPNTPHYAEYDFLREVLRPQMAHRLGIPPRRLPDALQADRLFADQLRQKLAAQTEQQQNAFAADIAAYREALQSLKISPVEVEKTPGVWEAATRVFLLLLGLPIALYGMLFTALPMYLGRRKAAGIATRIKNKMLQSSFDFVITQVLFTGAFYLLYSIAYLIVMLCLSVSAWQALCGYAALVASWVITRAFWQDYLHYASRSLCRFRAWLHPKKCRDLQALRAKLAL